MLLVLLLPLCVSYCQVAVEGRKTTGRLVTFNAGFTPRLVPKYLERRPFVIQALKRTRADFICLQEVFYGQDVYQITEGLKQRFPFSYSQVQQQNGTISRGPPCSSSDLLVLKCLQINNCLALPSQPEQLICAIQKCSAFTKMSQGCLTCFSITSNGNMTELATRCITSPLKLNPSGVIILSKRPMRNLRTVKYNPGINQLRSKVYLQANVKNIGHILCTHLTGDDGPIYFGPNLPYKSYAEQNLAEVKGLLRATQRKRKAVIMGDLNCGPIIPSASVVGELQDSYRKLLRKGYKSSYVDKVGLCTFCFNNSLTSPFPNSLLIDHVMTKRIPTRKAKRLYTSSIPGNTFPISDHYGVQVTIKCRRY